MFNYSGDQSGLHHAHYLVASYPKIVCLCMCVVVCEHGRGYKMRLVSATWRLHVLIKNKMSSIGTRLDGARISASPCFPDKESPIPLLNEFDLRLSPFIIAHLISTLLLRGSGTKDMKLRGKISTDFLLLFEKLSVILRLVGQR